MKKVFVSAGEASGDLHAAALIKELQARETSLEFFGLGGDLMATAGVELLYDLRVLAVTGFWEVAKQLLRFRRIYREVKSRVEAERPDLVLLVDYPGMNLKLAAALKEQGYRVVYFILPQVWAWHASRIKKLKASADLLLAILPFEPDLFNSGKMQCHYVGHPLLDIVPADDDTDPGPRPTGIDLEGKVVCLLPGSRLVEVTRLYPVMLETAAALQRKRPELQFVTLVRDELGAQLYRRLEARAGINPAHFQAERYWLLRHCELSLVASGTATLEAALCGRPFCIVYKTGWLTYQIARRVIKLDHVGLANIVAGKEIVPEYLQSECTSENLLAFSQRLLSDEEARFSMMAELARLRAGLGRPGAAKRAADLIMAELGG